MKDIKYFSVIVEFALFLTFIVIANSCKNSNKSADAVDVENDSVKSFQEFIQRSKYPGGLILVEYKGKLIYDRYCQVCHGQDGDGKGFNSFNLENSFGIKPFDFTDTTNIAKLLDDEINKVISFGGKSIGKSQYMPPWGGILKKDDIKNVIAYIKTFSKTK